MSDDTPPRGAPVARRAPTYPPAPLRPQATLQGVAPNRGLAAVQRLAAHLGEHETSKNQGPVVEWACRRWVSPEFWERHYPTSEMAWCAGAVSTALAEAGVDMDGIGSVSCDALLAHMRRHGWLVWARGERAPLPGDVVFFGPQQDLRHVGLVESCVNGEVRTVEGNAGDQVRRRKYLLGDAQIAWFARVP